MTTAKGICSISELIHKIANTSPMAHRAYAIALIREDIDFDRIAIRTLHDSSFIT
jgi:hypothetical protein